MSRSCCALFYCSIQVYIFVLLLTSSLICTHSLHSYEWIPLLLLIHQMYEWMLLSMCQPGLVARSNQANCRKSSHRDRCEVLNLVASTSQPSDEILISSCVDAVVSLREIISDRFIKKKKQKSYESSSITIHWSSKNFHCCVICTVAS